MGYEVARGAYGMRMSTKYDLSHVFEIKGSGLKTQRLKKRRERQLLEPRQVEDGKLFRRAGDESGFLEAPHNADGRLSGDADHVGQILTGQPNGESIAYAV